MCLQAFSQSTLGLSQPDFFSGSLFSRFSSFLSFLFLLLPSNMAWSISYWKSCGASLSPSFPSSHPAQLFFVSYWLSLEKGTKHQTFFISCSIFSAQTSEQQDQKKNRERIKCSPSAETEKFFNLFEKARESWRSELCQKTSDIPRLSSETRGGSSLLRGRKVACNAYFHRQQSVRRVKAFSKLGARGTTFTAEL